MNNTVECDISQNRAALYGARIIGCTSLDLDFVLKAKLPIRMEPLSAVGAGAVIFGALKGLYVSSKRRLPGWQHDDEELESFRIEELSKPDSPLAEYSLLHAFLYDIDTNTDVASALSTVSTRI
jgi:hypothetical protein